MGLRRYLKPDLYRLPELGLRQGDVRMAVRPRDGRASRAICSRDGPGEAEGYRGGGAGAGREDGFTYSAWPMVSARANAQESYRNADCSCARILEHGDAIGTRSGMGLSPTERPRLYTARSVA